MRRSQAVARRARIVVFRCFSYFHIDYVLRCVLGSLRLAHRGAPPEAILKAERGSASRGCGSQPQAREVRKPTAGHYDPCREELAARSPEAMPDDGSADPHQKIAEVERRTARVPSAQGTQGASQAPGVPRHGTPAGCRCIRAPVGAPPPLFGADEGNARHPGAPRRGNEQCRPQDGGLFDIVSSKERGWPAMTVVVRDSIASAHFGSASSDPTIDAVAFALCGHEPGGCATPAIGRV